MVLFYILLSLGWFFAMGAWAFVAGPYVEPQCQAEVSFGFLPGIVVVLVAALMLYIVSFLAHGTVRFVAKRFIDSGPRKPSVFGDAMFFVPFAGLSLLMLSAVMTWSSSLQCFLATAFLALPWLATPIVNAQLARLAQR